MSEVTKLKGFVTFALVAVVTLGAAVAVRAQDDQKKDGVPKVEAIDFRKLKEWLPAELNGIKRKEAGGEKNKAGEITVSNARATYQKGEDENAPRIEIEVIDYGGVKDMAQGIAAAWTMTEIDRESDDGYERTVKIKDSPGMETWQKEGRHGQIQLLVGKRYIVNLQTDNIPAEQVRKIAEALPLEKLAGLK